MTVHFGHLKPALTASLVAAVLAASPADALEPREVLLQVEPSVVIVLASDAKGTSHQQSSGVLIAALEVVTSCKGITEAADIVVAQGGALRTAAIQHADAERDLCQLRLREPLPTARAARPATNGDGSKIGDYVYVVSSPRGLDRTLKLATVSGLREVPGAGNRLLQLDVNPEQGSFGGGVFDAHGNLVGILTPQFRQSDSMTFAVPVAWIAELASRAPEYRHEAPSQATGPAPSAATPADTRWYPAKGDLWRYRLLDGKRPIGTVNIEIVESGGGRVRERVTRDDSPGFSIEREVSPELSLDAFEPQVNLPGGYQLLDLSAYFPPETDLPDRLPRYIPGSVRIEQMGVRNLTWSVRLAGREKVRAPAGEFESWRIDATAQEVGPHGPVKIEYRVWYSRAMQRAVKMSLSVDFRVNVGKSSETLELAAFEKGS